MMSGSRALVVVCVVLGLAGVGVAAYLAYSLATERAGMMRAVQDAATTEAAGAAEKINTELERLRLIADGLADDLGTRRMTRETLTRRLAEIRTTTPTLADIAVAYSEADLSWFAEAVTAEAGWREPTWQGSPQTVTAAYAAPFTVEGGPAGVVHLAVRLDRYRDWVVALDVGQTGWGVVASAEGYVFAHPSEAVVRRRSNLRQLGAASGGEAVVAAVESALRGERGLVEGANQVTGQASWFAYEPVEQTGWTVIVVRIQDEVARIDRPFRRRVIWISVCAICGLILLASGLVALLCANRLRRPVLWAAVAFASILMMAGMGVIRRVAHSQLSDRDTDSIRIVDRNGLASFLNAQDGAPESQPERFHVPTGVFVQSLKFIGAKEIQVNGYVWQRFTAGLNDSVTPGFILPDALRSEISEAYRHRGASAETVGWYFDADLRQHLELSRYPFDHESLSIRLWPSEFGKNVILVPDLDSYTLANPASLPGLENDVTLSGWDLTSSFFVYRYTEYGADLGIPERRARQSLPELHFNVSIKRRLFDAGISNGIPVLVVLAMLFAILVTTTRNQEESQLVGFTPSSVMRATAALFFVTLLAHIQLRSTLEAQEVLLMEYTYFTVYLSLLAISIHAFLFSLRKLKIWIIDYEDSLILKLFYWPAIFAVQYGVTAIIFY